MNYARYAYGLIWCVGGVAVINNLFPPSSNPFAFRLLLVIALTVIYALTDWLLFARMKRS